MRRASRRDFSVVVEREEEGDDVASVPELHGYHTRRRAHSMRSSNASERPSRSAWRWGCASPRGKLKSLPGLLVLAFGIGRLLAADAAGLETKPDDRWFAKFQPKPAPAPSGLLLQTGDRLAICGDSITEQKMYSRVIETYLSACVPELKVTVRQYGWGGETAPGFLARMTNDCLRFAPTVGTTCYGMNDHGYRAYEAGIGERYRDASRAIIRAFQAAGARVVHGSPGCVGPQVPWSKSSSEDMNLSLCELRNIGIELAAQEQVGFADVFWPT